MAFFDNIADACFSVIGDIFGDIATWQPSAGGDIQTAKVLYKDATQEQDISNNDFVSERYTLEYSINDFVGLKQSVDNSGTEKVRLFKAGKTLEFTVTGTGSKYDGRTLLAYLTPPTEI